MLSPMSAWIYHSTSRIVSLTAIAIYQAIVSYLVQLFFIRRIYNRMSFSTPPTTEYH